MAEMTAEEIVKLLKHCASNEDNHCESCVLDTDVYGIHCIGTLQSRAADLIETQAKEIESLQSKIKELEEKINPPKEEHPYFREYS